MSAVLVALYESHAAAEQVRTRLVADGFPTDRVDLTSRQEPGRSGVVPADSQSEQFVEHFRTLFDRDARADSLARHVREGAAAVTVHPRGDIETMRAREILERADPLDVAAEDLGEQALEHAASDRETPLVQAILVGRRH